MGFIKVDDLRDWHPLIIVASRIEIETKCAGEKLITDTSAWLIIPRPIQGSTFACDQASIPPKKINP